MVVGTFETDAFTQNEIAKLQKTFGVNSNSDVIRHAIALARVAAVTCNNSGIVVMQNPDAPNDVCVQVKLREV